MGTCIQNTYIYAGYVCADPTTSHFRSHVLCRDRGAGALPPDGASPCRPGPVDLDAKGSVLLVMQKVRVVAFECLVLSRGRQAQNITRGRQSDLRTCTEASSCGRLDLNTCVGALGAASNFCTFFGNDGRPDSLLTRNSLLVSLSLTRIHESEGMQGISSAVMERGCVCTLSHFHI